MNKLFSRVTRRSFIGISFATIGSFLSSSRSWSRISLRAPLDILIRGGSVLDGTGSPEKMLNVGIRDGKIAEIGALEGAVAGRVIDVKGHYVVPGFIDIHSHVDTSIFRDPHSESKVRQGVTTEVSGMDGDSAAPLGGPSLDRQLREFEEAFGFPCPYRDLDGYFTALAKNGTAQNVVTFVGLGTVREKVVGLDNRPATDDEMEAMKKEVLLGIEQGAYGVSTGLEYTPGSFASTRELWEVVKVVPERFRLYATHMRNEDDRVLGAIEEAITIARESGARLQVSHLKAQNKTNWPKQKIALEMLEAAIASGMNAHADRYPYLAYSTGLTNLFPLWSREGDPKEFINRLQDPETLPRIRREVEKKVAGLGSWDAVMISSVHNDENKKYQGRTVQQIVEGSDPFAFVVDLLIQEDARVGMVGFGMNEEGTEMVLAWPRTSVASDGGAYSPQHPTSTPHPRCYGTFPRAIALYQRERHITTLPDMIRKMTSLPASTLGLPNRGILAAGNAADVVIFNYNTIRDNATFLNPHQFPDGIPYVIVNGTVVVDDNKQNDSLPGEVVRSRG
jgi:N-acyl-D-aspartate/D-glutamate deacylase